MTKARLVLPSLPEAVSAGVLQQQAARFTGLVRDDLADASAVDGFVPVAERVVLHPDETPRRALLAEAAADPRLAVLLLGTVFPRVARLLEEGWNTDRLSFVDVTIAAARLQDAVRVLGQFTLPARTDALVMVVPPWEQHTLPASLAAARLRRKGVPIRLIQAISVPQMLPLIARCGPAGVLISVGSYRSAGKLRPLIGALRSHVPRALPIVVGGPAMESDAAVCRRSGADLATNDLDAALSFCELALDDVAVRQSNVDA
ncbi:hypothetical protein [Jannaschia formosa]|uniref:hypothetical protein n=1 Tax=Jannaschia formosa TaxID=2259592 RepID=UPI000E1B60CC|nr:hypothetical protein [Jannaschia formosa]TFL19318.1 hypothetical protein DR046_05180 [Jannaschia formosa]